MVVTAIYGIETHKYIAGEFIHAWKVKLAQPAWSPRSPFTLRVRGKGIAVVNRTMVTAQQEPDTCRNQIHTGSSGDGIRQHVV